MRKYYISALVTAVLLPSLHISYVQDMAGQSAPISKTSTTEQKVESQSPVMKKIPTTTKSVSDSGPHLYTLPIYDYKMTGYVKNVYFSSTEPTHLCYVAINDSSSIRNNRYHASSNYDVCKFAERAKILNKKIKMLAKVDNTGQYYANDIVGLSLSDTNAKWWGEE